MEKPIPLKRPASGQLATQYRLLVQSVKDYGIFLLDSDGYIQTWNPGAARIKGYTAKEIIGQHFSLFYPQVDKDRGKPAYELKIAIATGKYEEEGWRVRKDQTLFWANIIITPVYNRKGQLTGFSKVTRDLTAWKQSDMALQASDREKHHQTQLLLAIIEHSPAGIALLEPVLDLQGQLIDFKFIRTNAANAALSGRSAEEFTGRLLRTLFPQAQAQQFWQQLVRCYQTGEQQQLTENYTGDGLDIWIEGTFVKLGGNVLWVFQDVTPLKRVQLELEEKLTHLQEAKQQVARALDRERELNQLKSEFVKLVSHQFRTPMTSILLNAELLKRHGERSIDGDLAQRVIGYGQQVVGDINRLSRLINTVLVHERVQLKQVAVQKECLNLEAFCSAFLQEQQHQPDYHRVVFRPEKPEIWVKGDAILLEQVLENLISNALKYSSTSQAHVEVRVDASLKRGKVLVKDYGIGIPTGEIKHLRRGYYRASNSDSYSGTGLGLSLTNRIVKLHGGQLTIHSQQNHYTLMTVRLPLERTC